MIITIVTTSASDVRMFQGRMRGAWEQDERASVSPGFQWKFGIDGGISTYWLPYGTRDPGMYNTSKRLSGLDTNLQVFYRVGLRWSTYTFWGEWLDFTTTIPIVETLSAVNVTNNSVRLRGMWDQDDRGSVGWRLEWKKGVDGPLIIYQATMGTRAIGHYEIGKNYSNMESDKLYYFRFGLKVKDGAIYYGRFLKFFTGVRTIYYRAFAMDKGGVVRFGEVKSFETTLSD